MKEQQWKVMVTTTQKRRAGKNKEEEVMLVFKHIGDVKAEDVMEKIGVKQTGTLRIVGRKGAYPIGVVLDREDKTGTQERLEKMFQAVQAKGGKMVRFKYVPAEETGESKSRRKIRLWRKGTRQKDVEAGARERVERMIVDKFLDGDLSPEDFAALIQYPTVKLTEIISEWRKGFSFDLRMDSNSTASSSSSPSMAVYEDLYLRDKISLDEYKKHKLGKSENVRD